MADGIAAIVSDRLDRDVDLDDDAKLFVKAALDGALDEFIEGGTEEGRSPRPRVPDPPAGAYLRRLSITGFRGIGPPADLDLVPGPGLTLVVGANGTGKSSFAEGLEFLLTGRISRWAGKSQQWIGSWRNLHCAMPPHLQACFTLVDGKSREVVAERCWDVKSNELHDHTTKTRVGDRDEAGLRSLNWETALETHRPFISHDRLTSVAGMSPSTQFDVMAAGLGLEQLTGAMEWLRAQRLAGQETLKKAHEELDSFRGELEALDEEHAERMRRGRGDRDKWQRLHDERLSKVRKGLSTEPWDLEAIKAALYGPFEANLIETPGSAIHWSNAMVEKINAKDLPLTFMEELALDCALNAEDDASLYLLRMIVNTPTLDITEIDVFCGYLCDLDQQIEELGDRATTRAGRLHKTLKAAVLAHDHYAYQPCPVCQLRHLDSSWLVEASTLMPELEAEANDAKKAFANQQFLQALIRDKLSQLPRSTIYQEDRAEQVKLSEWTKPRVSDLSLRIEDTEVDYFMNMLSEGKGLLEFAETIRGFFAHAHSTREGLRKRAREELKRRATEQRYREHLWHLAEQHLKVWLKSAEQAQRAADEADAIPEAERWLTDLEGKERAKRFRPIASQAQQYWKLMGKGSSVSLGDLALIGRGASRSLNIPVSVDGHRDVGLAVMSQGELSALSLSLFLARALQKENPFHFLVVDDPVQAMDPTKVEGLARALKKAAAERQVIVFTHDERLPAVVRRLQIEHCKITITRSERSAVQCERVSDPVTQHLSDARDVLRSAGLIPETRQRVIPGFCGLAIEAACVEAVRCKYAEKGHDPSQTEEAISNARTLKQKLALVLLDDASLAGEALRTLNNRFEPWAGDVVNACNQGRHGSWKGNPDWLFHKTRELTEFLRA